MMQNIDVLIVAIIEQAVRDYKFLPSKRNEVKRFFRSEYFKMLSDLDGEFIILKLEKLIGEKQKVRVNRVVKR